MKNPLPIDDQLPGLLNLIKQHQNVVLTAEPGAGKTTRVPPALLKAVKGKILILEPRRVAAIAAADRVAQENAWKLGAEVGYAVRFDSAYNSDTRLIFMTEALLARRMSDPDSLKDVEMIILDEFHERSIHVDLALSLIRERQEMGETIRLLVMSATLNAAKISEFLGDAPQLHIHGSTYDLEIKYYDRSLRPIFDSTFLSAAETMTKRALNETDGDVLVFLPGVGEITRLHERLEEYAHARSLDLLHLHGSLSLSEQREALRSRGRRRLILATNVAESSVTVDGVRAVVDSGLARIMRWDLSTGFSRLELSRISLFSATQRAGRAARQAPGVCYRLWNAKDEVSWRKEDVPEIQRADLSDILLFLAHQGVTRFDRFTWFEPPSLAQIQKAEYELQSLGLLTPENRITEAGHEVIQCPLPVRWGHFLRLCYHHNHLSKGARLAAEVTDRSHRKDLVIRQLESTAHRYFQKPKESTRTGLNFDEVVLLAFQNQLCRRRENSEKGKMVGGRGVQLASESSEPSAFEFFVALDGRESSGASETRITQFHPVPSEVVHRIMEPQIQESHEIVFDEDGGRILQKRVRRFRDLELEEPRWVPADPDQVEEHLTRYLQENINFLLERNEKLNRWMTRWKLYTTAKGHDPLNKDKITSAIQMACTGARQLKDVLEASLTPYFEMQCDHKVLDEFHKEAPEVFKAPTGSKFQIHYHIDKPPFVEVRLQELFGITKHPLLLFGRVPLQFHLLGPNYRAVQVTRDLESFWKNTYPEVRKELRARYPKHSWPENPFTAEPQRKGRSTR